MSHFSTSIHPTYPDLKIITCRTPDINYNNISYVFQMILSSKIRENDKFFTIDTIHYPSNYKNRLTSLEKWCVSTCFCSATCGIYICYFYLCIYVLIFISDLCSIVVRFREHISTILICCMKTFTLCPSLRDMNELKWRSIKMLPGTLKVSR